MSWKKNCQLLLLFRSSAPANKTRFQSFLQQQRLFHILSTKSSGLYNIDSDSNLFSTSSSLGQKTHFRHQYKNLLIYLFDIRIILKDCPDTTSTTHKKLLHSLNIWDTSSVGIIQRPKDYRTKKWTHQDGENDDDEVVEEIISFKKKHLQGQINTQCRNILITFLMLNLITDDSH